MQVGRVVEPTGAVIGAALRIWRVRGHEPMVVVARSGNPRDCCCCQAGRAIAAGGVPERGQTRPHRLVTTRRGERA